MDLHMIACVAQGGALDGFKPSRLDRLYFRALTLAADPGAMAGELLAVAGQAADGQADLQAVAALVEAAGRQRSGPRAAVIVGRRTFDAIGGRPFPGRDTVVISRSVPPRCLAKDCEPGRRVWWHSGLWPAIAWATEKGARHCWIAGGGEVYAQALAWAGLRCDLYLTRLGIRAAAAKVYMPRLEGWAATWSSMRIDADRRRLVFEHLARTQ